ncbi:MAG: hypothetical protein M1831_001831 [Alyxoria varia]|nr:MAG: hypothetical protein M1831_001831 [Alyxoria varia]
MPEISSIRAASNAERYNSVRPPNERSRASATSIPDTSKTHSQRGFGINAADRRLDKRSPFSAAESSQQRGSRQRDTVNVPIRDEGSRRNASGATKRSSADRGPDSWDPHASLIATTSAPLACRITAPPLSSLAPKELQPQPLNGLTLAEQERAILDDLLFVFMGFEGQYVRFVDLYNPSEEIERLAGPDFHILPGLDPSLRDLAYSMLKIAKYYIALEAFIEVQSREEFGTVNHALCASIRKSLKDFLVLVAQIEHQILTNDDFTLHLLNLHTKPTSHMLFQLYSLAQEILKKNSILEEDEDPDDMEDVENIIDRLREGDSAGLGSRKVCKGGNVLGLITNRLSSMSGDPAARTLLTTLLRESSRPYMNMLNEWLHHGGIRDPHSEFLIREQKSIKREGLEQDYTDEYWEKRYTIRDADVPPQLEGVKEKVLLAGKYLNVVRECGGVDISKEVRDVPLSFDDQTFLENVNNAYANANTSLLTLLLTTHSLPARLRSLKHYFFLDRSDFFSYFLELGTSELRKPAKSVNTGKLQSLLDIVLRQPGSVAAEDPFKEDVKVQMNEIGLTNWLMRIVNVTGLDQDAANTGMTNLLTPAAPASATEDKEINGFEALVFDYAVPFPLSLVISRVTLTRYQLLFRYLLSLRHLETLLVSSWTDHSKAVSWRHRSSNPRIENWKRRAWTLRARMLVFVQQLLYFCTAEVIEPNWQSLMARLNERQETRGDGEPPSAAKRTVDELMQDHVDFLATCLKECMLTNSKLLRINSKVMTTCSTFANYTSSLSRHLAAADADLSSSSSQPQSNLRDSSAVPAHDPGRLDKIFDTLQRYEDHFNRHLKILLDALNYLAATETVVFLGLCARLSTASEGGSGGPAGDIASAMG